MTLFSPNYAINFTVKCSIISTELRAVAHGQIELSISRCFCEVHYANVRMRNIRSFVRNRFFTSCKVQPDTYNLSLKLIHMMDLGPEVNGHLTTLLWKVEKILENQQRVLKNQETLLKLMEQQQATTGAVVSGERRLVNGVRSATKHEHTHTGELRLPSNLLESVAHLTNEPVSDTNRAAVHSSAGQKGSKALKKRSGYTKTTEPNGPNTKTTEPNGSSVTVDEGVDSQNVVQAGSKYSLFISPSITALNSGCVNCDSSSGTAEVQDENSSDKNCTKELLAWAERIQKTSCSIGNFSVNLVKVLFTKDEMLNKNCSGTRGKGALDSGKLDLIKFCAFKLYSVPEAEQDMVWKQKCVVSIDEYLRRGNRTRVQNRTKDAAAVVPLDSSVVNRSGELDDVKDDKNITVSVELT